MLKVALFLVILVKVTYQSTTCTFSVNPFPKTIGGLQGSTTITSISQDSVGNLYLGGYSNAIDMLAETSVNMSMGLTNKLTLYGDDLWLYKLPFT